LRASTPAPHARSCRFSRCLWFRLAAARTRAPLGFWIAPLTNAEQWTFCRSAWIAPLAVGAVLDSLADAACLPQERIASRVCRTITWLDLRAAAAAFCANALISWASRVPIDLALGAGSARWFWTLSCACLCRAPPSLFLLPASLPLLRRLRGCLAGFCLLPLGCSLA